MHMKPAYPATNAMLAGDSAKAIASLEGAETVALTTSQVVVQDGDPLEYVYFPLTAVFSVMSSAGEDAWVQTAIVGHEGMVPLAVVHGSRAVAERVVRAYESCFDTAPARMASGHVMRSDRARIDDSDHSASSS